MIKGPVKVTKAKLRSVFSASISSHAIIHHFSHVPIHWQVSLEACEAPGSGVSAVALSLRNLLSARGLGKGRGLQRWGRGQTANRDARTRTTVETGAHAEGQMQQNQM